MKCLLDNIIFSLQKSGGASVVWKEHLSRLTEEKDVTNVFIDYKKSWENISRRELKLPENDVRYYSDKLLWVSRYMDLKLNDEGKHIFHSSHYRINKAKDAINVTTVHDFIYEKFVSGLRRIVHSAQKKHAILNSDAVICVSKSTRNDLLRYMPEVDKEKIHVIYNGVNPCYHILTDDKYQHDIPFDTKAYVLYVGMRHPKYKNFSLVVDFCSQKRLPLIMVGGEVLMPDEYRTLTNLLGVGQFKHYRGIDTEFLNELYNRALLLIYPSMYEGFGIPVIEAQRAGCPVIAFNNSSLPEVMGKSPLLLEEISLQSLSRILEDVILVQKNRDEEIARGIQNANLFSWDITYRQTLELYKGLFDRIER